MQNVFFFISVFFPPPISLWTRSNKKYTFLLFTLLRDTREPYSKALIFFFIFLNVVADKQTFWFNFPYAIFLLTAFTNSWNCAENFEFSCIFCVCFRIIARIKRRNTIIFLSFNSFFNRFYLGFSFCFLPSISHSFSPHPLSRSCYILCFN